MSYSVEGVDGQMYGPVDDSGLAAWAREGRVLPTTRIRVETSGSIVTAAQLPALQSVFNVGPNVAPPAAQYPHPAPAQPVYSPAQPAQPQWPNAQVVGYATPVGLGGGVSASHTFTEFSVAAVVLLHIFTFGIFSFFYWNLLHDKLPRNRSDDPSGGKAIGFCFIPFFNLYWIFFSSLRLVDRIDEQRKLRGLAPNGKGLIITGLIINFIPYVNILVGMVIWPIAWGILQSNINELVRYSAGQPGVVYR